jgi:segregation and condensation protein A
MYQVKTDKFEGPMDLLLELIQKEKLEITELSLSRVANEYLEHIKSNQNINLENLADFLSVASRLILIKSRALLPTLKFTEEEEEEIQDLAHQLEEYKKFKEASLKIGEIAKMGKICYSREGFATIKSIFYPPEDFNAYDFRKYFQAILSEIPILEKLSEEIVSEVVTLEEKINELENFLRSKIQSSFSDLVEKSTDKVEVIVSFLAMLEMIKQRIVEVEQEDLFEEIKLSLKNN